MFKDDYRKEIKSITASENFKKDTISLMQERQAELQQSNTEAKTIKFNTKPYRKIAASVTVMLLAAAILIYSQSDFAISADNAETESSVTMEQNVEPGTVNKAKDNEYDFLPNNVAGNEKIMRVYTINDAVLLSTIAEDEKNKTKIYFNTQSNGSAGFEGYCLYSSQQLEQNPAYTVDDEFDSLPVYVYTPLSDKEIYSSINNAIIQTGFENSNLSYVWEKPVYDQDSNFIRTNSIYTDTPVSPGDGYVLCLVHGKLDNPNGLTGEIYRWPLTNHIGIQADRNLSDNDNCDEIINSAINRYGNIVAEENMEIYSWMHYNYYGEEIYEFYSYQQSENYGENLFNSTVNNVNFSQYKKYDEDEIPTVTNFSFTFPVYEESFDLPAIDYRQALDLLYSGQYFSSCPVMISEDTAISYIEMTYLEPSYDMQTKVKKGYSVPFYKFFVQLPEEFDRKTENGVLKTYGAYYVCAIHPEHIQLDDSYYKFN